MNGRGYPLSPFAMQAVRAGRHAMLARRYAYAPSRVGQPPPPEPPPAPPPASPAPPPSPMPSSEIVDRAEANLIDSIREGLSRITPALILVGIATGAAFAVGSGLVSRYVWRD